MKKNTKPFNVLLTDDGALMLNQLALQLECSKGQVIRRAIVHAFNHACNGTPTCASGRACLVPALHAQQVAAAPVNVTCDIPNAQEAP